ncbi:macro domain-containing protein [Donghicola tyrosinivorans]|uniref:O-acetyl-ADP-ribose deacetylase (Regulator of RNase III) n=1 Tax=Donghicola tyrosinivorans TaxID=1652492 RepID=A0A2T0WD12_9RHOB|nr:macro domain-containing protein [Donghicola tyrosinivorans]PRY84599.1 O-acetyl-ADP-ribose deacetylase (regulator of RNase III) [Donghicola tyrosinivorans]
MLTYKRTSLFEANTQTLVNTVNCVGVMGKGIAKAFKQREPSMFTAYKDICDRKLLEPGKLWLWRGSEQWILNFPTKNHWRSPSRIDWIESGLQKFVSTYKDQGVTDISFPKLGCGNGNLEWSNVKPLMEYYLSELPIPVFIHDFTVDVGLPEHLEHLASQVRTSIENLSFPNFMTALEKITEVAPTLRIDETKEFELKFNDGVLEIQSRSHDWVFEEDDLRGIWLSLLNGLVTKEKAGWTARDAAEPILVMMQFLPNVRAVQIHRHGRPEPEVAVELRPEAEASYETKSSSAQAELPWH